METSQKGSRLWRMKLRLNDSKSASVVLQKVRTRREEVSFV